MDFARGLGVLQSWQFLSGKFSLPLAIVTEKLILQKFTRIGRAGSQQRVGFLNLCTADILDWIILCYEGCPKYHQLLSRISGLYPLDVNGTCPPRSVTNQNASRHCQRSPGEQNRLGWEPLIGTEDGFLLSCSEVLFLGFLWHFLHRSVITSLLVVPGHI